MGDFKHFIHNLVVDGNDKEEDFIPLRTSYYVYWYVQLGCP